MILDNEFQERYERWLFNPQEDVALTIQPYYALSGARQRIEDLRQLASALDDEGTFPELQE